MITPLARQLETARLTLRPFEPDDAAVYAELTNERGPGGRGVPCTVAQAGERIAASHAREA